MLARELVDANRTAAVLANGSKWKSSNVCFSPDQFEYSIFLVDFDVLWRLHNGLLNFFRVGFVGVNIRCDVEHVCLKQHFDEIIERVCD